MGFRYWDSEQVFQKAGPIYPPKRGIHAQKINSHVGWRKIQKRNYAAKANVLQLAVLLVLQAHQEKLCRGNQVPRVSLGVLVLQVSLVSEGSLGSLDIRGAVMSLDVMRLIEEVSPDYVRTKVMILWLVSGHFSWARQRPLFIHQSCKASSAKQSGWFLCNPHG